MLPAPKRLHTASKVGNAVRIGGQHSDRIRRRDEKGVLAKNHVAILREGQ